MKRRFASVIAFVFFTIWISPAMGRELGQLNIEVVEVSTAGQITVDIKNPSDAPVRIWEDSNSWGAARWRVLVVRNQQVLSFFENPFRVFTINAPTFVEIAGKRSVRRKLDVNGGNWCGFGYCSSYSERGFRTNKAAFEKGDIVVVAYDVPLSPEAIEKHVWFGVTAAHSTVR